ncbi:MAG: twin transmembrane helix small protein [Alphaproteobacteria bacterium]|nr:twin transmembrane helix small protein [Alphaproteobacteria bacterium]
MAWQMIVLGLAMLAVLGVLFWGVITMARGGEYNVRWSNKIMRYRVVLQGIALLIFVVILLMAGRN